MSSPADDTPSTDPVIPREITRDAWRDALASVGIPTKALLSLQSSGGAITLTYKRVDARGLPVVAGTEMATVTYTVGICL